MKGIHDDGTAEQLNEAFYRTAPHDYFRQRLFNLLLVATKSDEIADMAGETIVYGSLQVGRAPGATSDEEENRALVEQFVATEAEILLHHISETLLRLYLAHERAAVCPWIELTRLRNFREFKQTVRGRFLASSEPSDESIARVLLGTPDPEHLSPKIDREEWKSMLDAARLVLRHAAHHLLHGGNLYNSVKHGFAVSPGDVEVRLGEEGTDLSLSASGASVEFLEFISKENEREVWRYTTAWVDVERSLALAYLCTNLIEGLWSAARRRYVGDGNLRFSAMDLQAVREILIGRRKDPITRFSLNFVVVPQR